MRMLAVIVRGHVAGDHDHGNRVERRVRDARRGVRESRSQMRQDHGSLSLRARVAIGHVRGDLLVSHVDELDAALLHRGENGDIGVAAQPKDIFNATILEVFHQLT